MNQKQTEQQVVNLMERCTRLEGDIISLRAKLLAVTSVLSVHMRPDNPESVLKQLEVFAERALSQLDVTAPQRQALLELIAALDLVKKHGGPFES
jgi:hypothetical protein